MERQNDRDVIKIGEEHFSIPTMKECEEFNRAADAFFMSRGLTGYGKVLEEKPDKKEKSGKSRKIKRNS